MLRSALLSLLVLGSFGMPAASAQTDHPTVTVAVAPMFIPWKFFETGVGQAIVEVKINAQGSVTSAKCVEMSEDFVRDLSYEQTAMQWHFSPAKGAPERTVRITFVFRIMPKGTREPELASIYSAPYQMEVRHVVIEPPVISDPRIDTRQKRNHNQRDVEQIVGPEPRAASFASSLVRRSCSVTPWPGQLTVMPPDGVL